MLNKYIFNYITNNDSIPLFYFLYLNLDPTNTIKV
jgi:hypothetical protein